MSLHQLSLPLGDYRGFINEQGVLFHTSYQTDHKTPSLGFDCLVTDVGAALYGNAVGLAECLHQRGRMSDLTGVFFSFANGIQLRVSSWISPHTDRHMAHPTGGKPCKHDTV